jgi:cellulose synthase/poly-beta-1,6-N-acetylglucosamine synthase-like glycosyltransferase
LLTCCSFLKYLRLLINCIAFWCYKPVPLSDEPIFTPNDVTVVIPSLDGDNDELRETVRSVLTNDPHKVILVTIDANLEKAEAAFSNMSKKIEIHSIPKANKRRQLCKALPMVTTEITILADDDVSWPRNLLPWMLSPFKDERMGGVGTNQRLRREKNPNVWNWLGAAYLIRRNWDCTACEFMDGGLPCLSGRTVAYRTHIIRDPDFIHSFTHETWRSCQLNADDDNFLTRWMVNHGWKTWIQYHRDCEVETTLEDNSKYLLQCLRWARSNWRSNLKSLFVEWTVWRYVHTGLDCGVGILINDAATSIPQHRHENMSIAFAAVIPITLG